MIDTIYLDTCSINRLTDDLGQPRLLAEADAMRVIFSLIDSSQVRWIASTLLVAEISRNPDPHKRNYALSLLPPSDTWIEPSDATTAVANLFHSAGMSKADALHIALARQARADWFITTDDRLERRAAARVTALPQTVNPVDWLRRRQPWLVPKSR